jgi:hypothetical protein
MKADFCVEALKEAIATYGKPEIMNSDQGSQFTGFFMDAGAERCPAPDIHGW